MEEKRFFTCLESFLEKIRVFLLCGPLSFFFKENLSIFHLFHLTLFPLCATKNTYVSFIILNAVSALAWFN